MEQQKTQQEKSPAALREEAVLQFWKENKIFEKTLEKDSPKGEFVFYEGPPGANGVPMLHHFEARAFKDVIPRYKTMQGFHVDRRAGWDCHGLPVELQVEKELGLASKKDIETIGIEKFNAECKNVVTRYTKEWELFSDRMGFWVDNDRAYYTMDANFIESGWNIIAKAHERGYLYQDYKILPWCGRCGTGLSSHELGQPGVYEDVKDISMIAKFKLVDFPNAYFLAWTTTPWTLPANVALAVGSDIIYVEAKVGETILVLAKDRLSVLTEQYEIIAEHKGSEMVGMRYEPLFPFLFEKMSDMEKEKAFRVYTADFVTTDTGTGIVHIAPMYGQDDFELATKQELPKMHIINQVGAFLPFTDFLSGVSMLSAEERKQVNIVILKYAQEHNFFFTKESYLHSYPHCWRCKTPLIYFARTSWYFAMSKLRNALVARNETINWEPAHIKEGRFGEWLRDARDWAISRERYWGTPLPIWVAEDGEKLVVDSFETLKKYTKKSGNNYFIMRHGHSESNERGVTSYTTGMEVALTAQGKEETIAEAQKIKERNIDVIISSPFLRTRQTAEIVAGEVGIPVGDIIYDERIRELNVGEFEGKPWKDYIEFFESHEERFTKRPQGGETLAELKHRMGEFLYEIEQKYAGKNILIISHGGPLWLLMACALGANPTASVELRKQGHSDMSNEYMKNSQHAPLAFTPLPHNKEYELDPHRPFIDEVVLEKDGKKFNRVKEVMDVWFDSGAMPFAQDHYPFENKERIDTKGYPADFISEAVDQTRGWFYTLLAVSALIDKPAPFKNAICLGHLLDAKGQKMSKSKGNTIDPWEQMQKFGADTVRLWMYSVTQPGDSKNYDEKVVGELHNKVFNLLYNVLSFYELYRDKDLETFAHSISSGQTSSNVLDVWILARLNQLTQTVTENLDSYKLLEPVRAIREFIDDLSTWYLRRSRDRIKEGDADSKKTLYTVLKNLSQLLAPVAPFAAEDLWQKLKSESDVESVHLTAWPTTEKYDEEMISHMQLVRDLCTVGNALRKKANIPVRQPLAFFFVTEDLADEYKELIKEELNVKAVEKGTVIVFDERITPELKREGDYRELIRAIQDLRKEKGLMPADVISLTLANEYKDIVSGFEDDLKKTVTAKEVSFADGEEKITIENE